MIRITREINIKSASDNDKKEAKVLSTMKRKALQPGWQCKVKTGWEIVLYKSSQNMIRYIVTYNGDIISNVFIVLYTNLNHINMCELSNIWFILPCLS